MQLLKDFSYRAPNGEQWLALTVSTVDATGFPQRLALSGIVRELDSRAASGMFTFSLIPDAGLLPTPKLIQ